MGLVDIEIFNGKTEKKLILVKLRCETKRKKEVSENRGFSRYPRFRLKNKEKA